MDDEKELSSNTFTGKLFKKGKFNKSWKTRYFIINRELQIAQYFEKEIDLQNNKNEKGHFDVNIVSKIEVSPAELSEDFLFKMNAESKHIALNDKLKSDKQHTFYLVSSPRTFVLAAPNSSDLMQWLQFLHSSLYGHIIKEGPLKKKGGLQKSFKSRYFILNEFHRLKYYDNEQLSHCLGAIDCHQITDIQHGKQYTFNIQIASRKWVLSAQNEEERSQWITCINDIRNAKNTELNINKRPMDDNSGYLERPVLDEKEQENEAKPNKTKKVLRVHKRPKDDDSGFFERPNLNADNLQEINEFDVVDNYNRWTKDKSNTIQCALNNDENQSFHMTTDEPLEFMIDLGRNSALKQMEIQFYKNSYCTKIVVYGSTNDDSNEAWTEIGDTQINSEPDRNAKISVTIDENHINYQCIKVVFGGEIHGDRDSLIQISRLRFYGVSGTIQKRDDITDKMDVFQTSCDDNDVMHVFKDDDEEWRHRFDDDKKDENVFIIFDTHGYILNEIDLEFNGFNGCKRIQFYETNTPNNCSSFHHIESYDTNLVYVVDEKQKEKVIETQRVRLDLKQNGPLAHDRFIKVQFIDTVHESWFHLKRIKFCGVVGENGELNEIIEKTSTETLVNDIAQNHETLTQMMGGMKNMMNNLNTTANNAPETAENKQDDSDEHDASDDNMQNIAQMNMMNMMGGMMNMMMNNTQDASQMMGGMVGIMNNVKTAPATEASENAIDLTQYIKILESFPETEDRTAFEQFKDTGDISDSFQFWSVTLQDEHKEAWLSFDTLSSKIDTVEISFPSYEPINYHAKTVQVFTAQSLDSGWKQIDIKTDIPLTEEQKPDPMAILMGKVPKPTKHTFYLKSQHKRYIKLVFSELTADYVGISNITWRGFEEKCDDEITDKVHTYQCSGETDKATEAEVVLRANNDCFTAKNGDHTWIIFDLGRFEVNRIKITFGKQSKPEIVKLRMSDVAPLYSFKKPRAMQWNLDTIHSFDGNMWEDVALVEELKLSGDEYNNGFKRFLHLEFTKYSAEQLKIVRIQFFGALSTRITAEDEEQFDSEDENKDEDNAPYEPAIADHSPTQSGFPVENVLDPGPNNFWMSAFSGGEKFLVLDLGNNDVTHVTVKAFPNYPYSTLRLSTANKVNTQQWNVLIVDTDMQSKTEDGGTFDLREYAVEKFIKFEFEGLSMPMLAVSNITLYGNSKFLKKMDDKQITFEDIKNMEFVDEDVIAQYTQKLQRQMLKQMGNIQMKMRQNEAEILSDEWIEQMQTLYEGQYGQNWKYTEVNAYQMKTTFERDEMLQFSLLQKQAAVEATKMMVDFHVRVETKKIELAEQEEKAKEAWQNQQNDTMKEEWEKARQTKKDYDDEWRQQMGQTSIKCSQKISEHQADDKRVYKIYESWKDAVLHHPMELSLEYNTVEYESCLSKAWNYDEEGFKKCMSKLADLFDESLKQRKQLLHKFLVYQLSAFYGNARPHLEYDMSPITIVVDCGAVYDQKIHRIELKIADPAEINRIIISTANELQVEEDDDNDDIEEKDNFKAIAEWRFNKDDKQLTESKKKNGLDFDDISIVLNYQNRRYVKVQFLDFDETNEVTVKRMKVYVVNKDNEIVDDDAKEDGEQLKKYKLKMIEENTVRDKRDYARIESAYAINTHSYDTGEGLKKPYLIFDCEQWSVDKFEMFFRDDDEHRFERMTVSTADAYVKGYGGNNDGWNVIFDESNTFESYIDKETPKIIQINDKNKRYLKISMILAEESKYIEMRHLKFYTNCNIDPNIKNLASQMTIVSATKCRENKQIEAILENTDSNKYSNISIRSAHIDVIKNRIRDEVCRCVNLLRKSRGASISTKEKHFIKFLLCFKNDKCYNEMLYSAKLVMKLLRKPLDVEYNRLQSINSRILALKLDTEYKCKGVTSNHKLLEWDYNTWYKPKTAMFWPQDLKPLTQKWQKVGLTLQDPEFSTIRTTGMLSTDKVFISSDELAMKYLNGIAHILDASFQEQMRDIFKENRSTLNLAFPAPHNTDLGVQSGPVKTEARQKIKILLKYFSKQPPHCMAVLDIVRCGIVCEDDVELCSLFDLIMKKFSGSILRVKNAFDDIKKGDDSHGYRAVMINIAFGDTKYLPKGHQMVCEAQLLLNKYYQVRKNMHLGYGICRSEDGGISSNKAPYVVLAQDACKLGKLDI